MSGRQAPIERFVRAIVPNGAGDRMSMEGASDALDIESEGTKQILPDAEGVFDAIGRIGYEFEHAIADIVDNSIDAAATEVLIRFNHDGKAVRSVTVIDNGQGMTGKQLDTAMAFGAKTKGEASLGKYGMGLKAASFSQCDVLTVISSTSSGVEGRRWTAEKARADWTCEVLQRNAAAEYLRRNGDRIDIRRGTLVEWDRLDALSHAMERPENMIERRFNDLAAHLGLIFHRFIESGEVRLRMDAAHLISGGRGYAQPVEALNPFPRATGLKGYPRQFTFTMGDQEIKFTAHVWRRNASDAGFKLGAGRLAHKQGFYVYRNSRIIQAGGWNGLRNDGEVHTSLARIEFDLPPTLDAIFKPTVQKSAVSMPEEMLKAIRGAKSGSKTFAEYLSDAETAYRQQKPEKVVRHGLVPTDGVTKELSRTFVRILGEPQDDEDEVRFVWTPMSPDQFVRIDPDTNTIKLNSRYRDAVLLGQRGSSGDAPLTKTLLMLLFKDDLARRNRMASFEAKLEVMNQLLVAALKAQW